MILGIVILATVLSMLGNKDQDGDTVLREQIEERQVAVSGLKVRLARIKAQLDSQHERGLRNQERVDTTAQQWQIVEGRIGRALSEKRKLLESNGDPGRADSKQAS